MTEVQDPFEEVTIRCETAEDFLWQLDETHPQWHHKSPWIFRGHNDATWEMKPWLYRLLNHQDEYDLHSYTSLEYILIQQFIRNVNLATLPIPPDSLGHVNRQRGNGVATYRRARDGNGDEMLFDFTHVAFAIAQHSGIPTRLMSFTFDPFVAAYFCADINNLIDLLQLASTHKEQLFHEILDSFQRGDDPVLFLSSCIREIDRRQDSLPVDVAVWALSLYDLQSETSIRVLDHPVSEMLTLRTQRGVFICDVGEEREYDDPFGAFDQQLSRLVEKKGVFKVTLPFELLPSLRRLLEKKRRFPLLVRPTYESIAESVLGSINEYRQLGRNLRSSEGNVGNGRNDKLKGEM